MLDLCRPQAKCFLQFGARHDCMAAIESPQEEAMLVAKRAAG